VILGGLLAGTPGIGRLIQVARLNGDSLAVLGYAALAGLIGVLFFWLFGELERVLVKWRPVS
jgi:ABC-type nitrate/sulfonate/bicarbonate transport system permease component